MTVTKPHQHARPLRGFAWALLVLAAVTLPMRVDAAEASLPVPFRLADALRIARERRSEIRAAKLRARAANERPAVVGAIEDPMIMGSIDHLPFNLKGVDASLVLEQRVPLSGILGDRKRAARAEARRLFADADRVALDVELAAAAAYLMLYEVRRMDRVLREQASFATQLREAALVRQSVARGMLADAARADIEVARLISAVQVNRAQIRASEAMLNAALNRRIGAAIPRLDFRTNTKAPPSGNALVPRARGARPELRAARAELSRARAEVDVMKSMYAPMAVFRMGPAYTMADGLGVMGMVGLSLPIVAERNRAGVREAENMVGMARAEIDAMTRMIDGQVANAREQVEAERIRLLTTRHEVLPRARLAVESALEAYAANELPLVSVVEAFMQLNMAREQEIEAEAALGMARVRLDRALGRVQRGRR